VAVSVKLDEDLTGRVRKLALTRQRSPHWVMHEAIKQYVEPEEARESFRQEALMSWASYEETGRHVTAREARAWLNSWESEDEAGPPECHA
jgi:predicted transcriptional regulator